MESRWIARRGASGSRKPAPHRSPALALFALLLGTTAAFRATAPRRAATATLPSRRRAATPRRRAATPRRRAATVLRDTVGYAGEAGSPGELAARAYFGATSTPTPTRSLEDLFVDVETGAVDYGILAVENSLRGSINKAFDLLLQHDLRIYGEIVVADCVEINHWFGGSSPNFRTLYLNQIEVDSADFWTDRLLSPSSRSTAGSLASKRPHMRTLKSG